ncbi:MAG: GNAT family N-acetyltransferase [Gammaproteobacteria bacterium]|nr:GNAT family N-acetyltransferase [Gammaproteobacteria bacterium]
MEVLINPRGMGAEFDAAFLTRCFSTGWTEAMCRWYLRRDFGGERPDRLLLMDDQRAVAGGGLAYRLLRTPDNSVHRVSVVVAACTAPGERGRGCYARLLQAAIARSASRGCTALLGFVTADNATGRGLLRQGATAIPSTYIACAAIPGAAGAAALRVRATRITDSWPERAGARLRCPPGEAGFQYPDLSSWRSQMVERPHAIQPLCVGGGRAIIELAGDTDRLQWLDAVATERQALIASLSLHARRRGRKFFMYSTRPEDAAAAGRLGLEVRPGFMMALATERRHEILVRGWAALPWNVQSGDRL